MLNPHSPHHLLSQGCGSKHSILQTPFMHSSRDLLPRGTASTRLEEPSMTWQLFFSVTEIYWFYFFSSSGTIVEWTQIFGTPVRQKDLSQIVQQLIVWVWIRATVHSCERSTLHNCEWDAWSEDRCSLNFTKKLKVFPEWLYQLASPCLSISLSTPGSSILLIVTILKVWSSFHY